MTETQEIDRGISAGLLLDNVIYKEAVEGIRNKIIQEWISCPLRDKDGQHELKVMLDCLDGVIRHIESVAKTGKMAQIRREESLAKRLIRKVA